MLVVKSGFIRLFRIVSVAGCLGYDVLETASVESSETDEFQLLVV